MENTKNYRYTIGLDPSGAFKEGKGTTGWCVLDNKTNTVLQIGTISAKQYSTYHEYWDAHIQLLRALNKQYGLNVVLSMEDYILYKNHAMAQVNSQMETVQLIGIIKQYCFNNAIDYFIRPAVAVKTRWADNILVHKGIISKINKHYILPTNPTKVLCDHERDSIRHAIHFNTFEHKGEK